MIEDGGELFRKVDLGTSTNQAIVCQTQPDLYNNIHEFGHVFTNHIFRLTGINPIDQIKPNKYNPNVISEAKYQTLVRNIRDDDIGYIQPGIGSEGYCTQNKAAT